MWKADPSGRYTAQTAYNVMRGVAVDGIQDRAFEELWKLKIPIKFAVFAWRLLKDRLPTKLNLHRRQIEILDRSCPFCRRSGRGSKTFVLPLQQSHSYLVGIIILGEQVWSFPKRPKTTFSTPWRYIG